MSTVYEREIRLFSLNSNRPLAEEIAKEIGVPLSDCQVKRFSDGELYINIEESVPLQPSSLITGMHVKTVKRAHVSRSQRSLSLTF